MNTTLFLSFFTCGKNYYSPPFQSWRKYLDEKKYSFPKIEILNLRDRRNMLKKKAHKETSSRNISEAKSK